MPETEATGIILGDRGRRAAPPAEESRNAAVLDVYAATLARSLNERSAFEAAVRLYRDQLPELPEVEARRAVANIICRKS